MSGSSNTSSGKSGLWRSVVRVTIPVVFAAALFYIFTEVARFGTVVSESMSPTLMEGDLYILRVDAYRGDRSPQRGEVVVFIAPDDFHYAKRIIAVENDRVGTLGGRVFLNGAWLEEPYVQQDEILMEATPIIVVPQGGLFLLGDNRNQSEDSRDYGPVSTDRVMGEVRKIVWPIGRQQVLRPAEYEREADDP